MLQKLLTQALESRAGDMGEGLLRGHQGQVAIGGEPEQIHHLSHHLPVLTGEHHPGAEARITLERQDHRCQFDRFRPGAQHDAHERCGGGQGGEAVAGILGKWP